jgi:hypothetical protein
VLLDSCAMIRQTEPESRPRANATSRVGPLPASFRLCATALDDGQRSPRKLLRALIARPLGRIEGKRERKDPRVVAFSPS